MKRSTGLVAPESKAAHSQRFSDLVRFQQPPKKGLAAVGRRCRRSGLSLGQYREIPAEVRRRRSKWDKLVEVLTNRRCIAERAVRMSVATMR